MYFYTQANSRCMFRRTYLILYSDANIRIRLSENFEENREFYTANFFQKNVNY